MQNEMRHRLIELQIEAYKEWSANTNKDISVAEFVTDYLIANGAILPPVKVGDCIWFIINNNGNNRLAFGKVEHITISNNNSLVAFVFEYGDLDEIVNEWSVPLWDFGKTVFLTEQEAREALKGGGKE